MGISSSPARHLMDENNRQSPISFAPGEIRAQELICFAQCGRSVRFVSQIRQTDMLIISVYFDKWRFAEFTVE